MRPFRGVDAAGAGIIFPVFPGSKRFLDVVLRAQRPILLDQPRHGHEFDALLGFG
jgi:hypothetical protein